jgi:hypothetical protein
MKLIAQHESGELCGDMLRALLLKEITLPSSAAMQAGLFFEQTAGFSGGEDRDVPELKLKGGGWDKAGRVALEQGYIMKHIAEVEKWFVGAVEAQSKFELTTSDGVPVLAFMDFVNFEDHIIRDLKLSAHLHNKWDSFGWGADQYQYGHALQAKVYSYLYWAKFGAVPTFEFWVFSSTKVADAKVFRLKIAVERMPEIKNQIKDAYQFAQYVAEFGGENYPNLGRCYECPLAATCKDYSIKPAIHEQNN